MHYAQKFLSTPGKRDGLYWEVKQGEEPSPLGTLVAHAREEGYKRVAGKPTPYHGCYYKILKGQGPDAPGGAYDYVVRGTPRTAEPMSKFNPDKSWKETAKIR